MRDFLLWLVELRLRFFPPKHLYAVGDVVLVRFRYAGCDPDYVKCRIMDTIYWYGNEWYTVRATEMGDLIPWGAKERVCRDQIITNYAKGF